MTARRPCRHNDNDEGEGREHNGGGDHESDMDESDVDESDVDGVVI